MATVDEAGVGIPDGDPDGGAVYHGYHKTPRIGRKVGHLTITGDAIDPTRSDALASIVPGAVAD